MSFRKGFFAIVFLILLLATVFAPSAQADDAADVQAAYNSAIAAYNAQQWTTFAGYISDNYMDDGRNKSEFVADAQQNWQSYNPTLGTVNIASDFIHATMQVSDSKGTDTEYFIKEAGAWKLYGNQRRYRINVNSAHWPNGYFAMVNIEDPGPTHAIISASVQGPGIPPESPRALVPNDWGWQFSTTEQMPLIATTAPGPATYTISITDQAGGPYTYPIDITGYVTDLPGGLAPTGSVTPGGTITFSWDPRLNATEWHVDLQNPQGGGPLWQTDQLPGSTTSVEYGGPTLNTGATYTYNVIYWTNGNMAGNSAQFTYGTASTISISGTVVDINNMPVPFATVQLVQNGSIMTTADGSGNYTLTGLPGGSPFQLLIQKSGYEKSYSFTWNTTSSKTGVNWTLFPMGWKASTGNAGDKGLITGKTRDSVNPSSLIAGATLTAVNQSQVPYTVVYQVNPDGGTSTGINGAFFVKNVNPGDTVTVAASKGGISFSPPTRSYEAFADGVTIGAFNGDPTDSATAWFTGRVRDFTGGMFLGGVTVQQLQGSATTTTGTDGSFTLTGVSKYTPITLKFSTESNYYAPSYLPLQLGGNAYSVYANFVLLTPSQLTTWGNTTGKGVILGRVSYTTNGNFNASGVTVTATGATHGAYPVYYQDMPMSQLIGQGTTFASGRFVVLNVEPGDTVTINASRPGFTFDPVTVTPQSDGVTLFKVAGTALAYVSGVVRDLATSAGIPNALVTLSDSNNNPAGSVYTAFDGTFYLGVGATGNYSITVSKPGYNYLMPPDPPGGTTISLGPDQTYNISTPLLMDYQGPTGPTLQLSQGWNFISLPVQPSDTNISTILSPIMSQLAIVWGWDSQNQRWLKFMPSPADPQQNTLLTMESGKGYWIYLWEAPTSPLPLSGTAAVTSIPLAEGWNLIGYNGANPSLDGALSNISGKWSIMWGWDNNVWSAAHATITQLPVPPLGTLSSGKAYWIRVKPGQGGNWQQ